MLENKNFEIIEKELDINGEIYKYKGMGYKMMAHGYGRAISINGNDMFEG
jgi:hypothetical protein